MENPTSSLNLNILNIAVGFQTREEFLKHKHRERERERRRKIRGDPILREQQRLKEREKYLKKKELRIRENKCDDD